LNKKKVEKRKENLDAKIRKIKKKNKTQTSETNDEIKTHLESNKENNTEL
jgi:hypothetical protein